MRTRGTDATDGKHA